MDALRDDDYYLQSVVTSDNSTFDKRRAAAGETDQKGAKTEDGDLYCSATGYTSFCDEHQSGVGTVCRGNGYYKKVR